MDWTAGASHNWCMKRPGLLILLLFLAVASVDLVVWSMLRHSADAMSPGDPLRWPHAPAALLLAFICGQVSLVAVWSGVARRPAPWPLAVAAVVVLAWGVLLSGPLRAVVPSWFGTAGWLIVLSAQALAVAGPLWGIRLAGMRLIAPTASRPNGQPRSDRPVQFSIAYVLAWMTALAIVLGLYRWSFEAGSVALGEATWSDRRAWLEIALVAVGNAAVAWPALWAMLAAGRPLLRMAAPMLAVVLLIGFYGLLDISPAHRWGIAVFYVAQTALLVGALGVVRIDGYRVMADRATQH